MKRKVVSISAISVLMLLIMSISALGQDYEEYPYPRDAFINPLGIDWKLSGTFGEPRGNHFHAGNDVKTNGATGYKLYAIADGHIARIKVSPWGYGKALYIAHPHGYTSVYGHMSSFNDQIDSLVRARQYAAEKFEQDIYLDPGTIEVGQGEIIGLSGNSGGSAGPHLHFEIRETASQKPLNPLFFGYSVADTRKPHVAGIKLTTLGSGFYVASEIRAEKYLAIDVVKDTIDWTEGKVAIGLHGYDQHDAAANKNGIFRIETFVDDASHFTWTMDRTSFDQGRYVNAFRDFAENKRRRTVYNCFRLPGNKLEVYEYLVDNGFIHLEADEVVKVDIHASDFHKNVTKVSFFLKGQKQVVREVEYDSLDMVNTFKVKYDKSHSFSRDGFKLYIPEGVLYDNAEFLYRVKENNDESIYSNRHQFHNAFVPLHKPVVVQIEPQGLPESLHDKVVMVHKDLKGVEQSLTTFWKDNLVTAKCREVGWFYLKADTVKPDVRWLNYTAKTEVFRGDQIRVHISDDLSGIREYDGYIDGEWVVFDYDAKRKLLAYDFDGHFLPGEHKVHIIVVDNMNNKTELKAPFTVP